MRTVQSSALALLLLTAPPVSAGPRPAAPPSEATPPPVDTRSEAKSHFDKGNVLYEQLKDPSGALAEFLESRRLYPTWSANYNAALCLKELKRYDEALELLEAVLRDFGATMPNNNREEVQRMLISARTLVGTVEIESAAPGATIAIDGQNRGEYPLLAPLRVATGSHVVQLYKEGFEPFGVRVDVAGGRTVHVVARLRALEHVGQLRMVEQKGRALDVLVDGRQVGTTPWQGRLAPGEHVVVLRGANHLGTAPVPVTIERDRITQLTLTAEELTSEIRVEPVPANASVAIDAVVVGRGVWAGRLRAGTHRIEVAAEGFLPAVRSTTLQRDEHSVLHVALERDPDSLFGTSLAQQSHFLVEASGAVAIVPNVGGDVLGACTGSCSKAAGFGGFGTLRVGYQFGFGLGFGLSGGYFTAHQKATDRTTAVNPVGLPETPALADDDVKLHGVLAGGWIGYRLAASLPLNFRLGAGALIGSVTDARNGTVTARSGQSEAFGPLVEEHPYRGLWLAPAIHLGLRLHRRFELYASVESLLFFHASPPQWDVTHGIHASTDGFAVFAADELTSRFFVVLAPGLGVRFDI